jgi:hypothetical protein
MSSLTIEMGLRRRHAEDEPIVPDAVATRDDVTLAQKQRLAVLAKMGLGPVADPNIRAPASSAVAVHGGRDVPTPRPPPNQKAVLMERERRFREQEEDDDDLFQAVKKQKPKPARPSFPGFQRLGPVQAREEDKLQSFPAPAKEQAPSGGITIKPIERSKIPSAVAADEKVEEPAVPGGEPASASAGGDHMSAEKAILAFLEMQKKKKAKALEREAEEMRQKQEKKKRKRAEKEVEKQKRGNDRDDDEEEDDDSQAHDREHRRFSESTKGPLMVVESVKGKVSNANKNMTDADLERRFMAQEREHRGSLMTEEQVLRMIRKEKTDKPASGNAARRIQKELAEWEAAKVQQRQRVKSPTRFERMVVARR